MHTGFRMQGTMEVDHDHAPQHRARRIHGAHRKLLCDHLTKRLDCTNRHLQPQRLRVPMFEVAAKAESRIGLTVATGLF